MGERLLGRDVQLPRTQQLLESDVVGEIQRGFRGGNLVQDHGAKDQNMRLTLFLISGCLYLRYPNFVLVSIGCIELVRLFRMALHR
jgi:hypothetical protein